MLSIMTTYTQYIVSQLQTFLSKTDLIFWSFQLLQRGSFSWICTQTLKIDMYLSYVSSAPHSEKVMIHFMDDLVRVQTQKVQRILLYTFGEFCCCFFFFLSFFFFFGLFRAAPRAQHMEIPMLESNQSCNCSHRPTATATKLRLWPTQQLAAMPAILGP